ncbi:nucleoside/nucleotide kinase family protein [Frondihabitans cladoniiphilus]|uniref:Nucleoside/nucleotide kinase family protein n=1 Tax=Frondihabitans cladoniiphilus TaxID=715785 RepID=A0ABP8W034_9MICO
MTSADAASGALAANVDALARRALALLDGSERIRVVVGIAGSPGSGKTTLAIGLVERLNELREGALAVHLPMDGYHLANATLDRLGRHDRKGAIDTFDGWGYVALLRRLRDETEHTVYAPSFDRTVDEGVAGEIAVPPSARIVVTEGNYLLVDDGPWAQVVDLLDETWFCETGPDERLRRLVDRHERHGRTPEEAEAWATSVDGTNALLIEASAPRAVIRVSGVDASIVP